MQLRACAALLARTRSDIKLQQNALQQEHSGQEQQPLTSSSCSWRTSERAACFTLASSSWATTSSCDTGAQAGRQAEVGELRVKACQLFTGRSPAPGQPQR